MEFSFAKIRQACSFSQISITLLNRCYIFSCFMKNNLLDYLDRYFLIFLLTFLIRYEILYQESVTIVNKLFYMCDIRLCIILAEC